jgi:hypothetical protein
VARKGPRTEDGRIGIYRKDQFGVLKFLTFGTIFLITLTATPFAAMGGEEGRPAAAIPSLSRSWHIGDS